MHEERIQLIEGHAILRASVARKDGIIGGEHARRESSKELHHGEIDLAMADGTGRIDEVRCAPGTRQDVSGPEVSVESGENGLAHQAGERAS